MIDDPAHSPESTTRPVRSAAPKPASEWSFEIFHQRSGRVSISLPAQTLFRSAQIARQTYWDAERKGSPASVGGLLDCASANSGCVFNSRPHRRSPIRQIVETVETCS